MAEKITMWETKDGKTFETEGLANAYEDRIDILAAMRDKPMKINGIIINPEEIIQYIDSLHNVCMLYLTERLPDGH